MWTKQDILCFLLGLIGGYILYAILLIFHKPECPVCKRKIPQGIEMCPGCKSQLRWR